MRYVYRGLCGGRVRSLMRSNVVTKSKQRVERGLLAVALCFLTASPASASSEPRPSTYIERGELQTIEDELTFVSDAERGERGGHWFRLGGQASSVFYCKGSHPATDWIWPNHKVSQAVWEIVRLSPGGSNYLMHYQEAAEYTTGFARIGVLATVAGLGAAGGGLAYNLTNATREMQPLFFVGAGLAALAGLGLWAGATAAASSNEALLDQALDAYNRELAARRNQAPLSNPYVPSPPPLLPVGN